jgi:hypothetical protein
VRRIAIGAIAGFLALTGTAQAFKTSSIQVHNQTREELVVGADTGDGRSHYDLDPGQYLVLKEVVNGSCVRIHFPGKTTDENCIRTETPIGFSCDLPVPYQCVIHEGKIKDLVVTVFKGHAPGH